MRKILAVCTILLCISCSLTPEEKIISCIKNSYSNSKYGYEMISIEVDSAFMDAKYDPVVRAYAEAYMNLTDDFKIYMKESEFNRLLEDMDFAVKYNKEKVAIVQSKIDNHLANLKNDTDSLIICDSVITARVSQITPKYIGWVATHRYKMPESGIQGVFCSISVWNDDASEVITTYNGASGGEAIDAVINRFR